MKMNKTPYQITVLILWLLAGLYFGTGGITKIENNNLVKQTISASDTGIVVFQGQKFKDKEALVRHLEGQQISAIYPWIDNLPSYVSYLITACSFGLLGAIVRIFMQLTFQNKSLSECKVYTLPVLGLLTGLVMLGVFLIFPIFFITSDSSIRPGGLMFLCLFAGIYLDAFYKKVSKLFDTVLKTEK